MSSLFLVVSAIVQLGLVGAIVTYSFQRIRRRGGHKAIIATAYVTTVAIVVGTLFICSGGFIEKFVSRGRMQDIGVVATVAMVVAATACGSTALVCLIRRIQGWRVVFVLQSVTALYLALILTYVAMGKPFSAR
jgi:hypothetical protein